MTGPRGFLVAAIFGVSACAAPAHAASGRDQPPPESAGKTVERDKPAGRKAEGSLDDLVTCKRDATRLHGPERARFMTRCIRKR